MHDYANAVIQGRAYRPDDAEASATKTEKGDLGVEVARLNYAIDDVTRQLRQEVSVCPRLPELPSATPRYGVPTPAPIAADHSCELTSDHDIVPVTPEPPDDVTCAVIAAGADQVIPHVAVWKHRPIAQQDPRPARAARAVSAPPESSRDSERPDATSVSFRAPRAPPRGADGGRARRAERCSGRRREGA